MSNLNKDTLYEYAVIHYNSVCSTRTEFESDLKKTAQIQKSLNRIENPDFNVRILINYIISFFNVFEQHAAIHILFLRISDDNHSKLKSVLIGMYRFPNKYGIQYNDKIDMNIVSRIRKELQ